VTKYTVTKIVEGITVTGTADTMTGTDVTIEEALKIIVKAVNNRILCLNKRRAGGH
jgi:hypothetical protein